MAHGLSNLERMARWFMIVLVVSVSLTTVDARRHYPNWRAVTENVTRYHLDSEPVLMDVWVGDFPVRYYMQRQMGATNSGVSRCANGATSTATYSCRRCSDYIQRCRCVLAGVLGRCADGRVWLR